MNNLNGKTILLTGAAGHLGMAMAKGFAEAGGYVYLNGRDSSKLQSLYENIKENGGQASVLSFDITDSDAASLAFQTIEEKFGKLDVLVNNAYYAVGGTLETSMDEDFTKSYNVAVTAAAGLIRVALPLLRQSGIKGSWGASVINISSMYGIVSPDLRIYDTAEGANPPCYGASKAALLQLTRYVACELAKDKIRVNSLCPGPFPTPSVCDANPEFIKKMLNKVPLGRVGDAIEIVGPAIFLASDASSYVTGTSIAVDGGWTAW